MQLLLLVLMMLLIKSPIRWWEKKEDNMCSENNTKSSRMGPEQLSGSFLLLASGIALTIGVCTIQMLVAFLKGHISLSM